MENKEISMQYINKTYKLSILYILMVSVLVLFLWGCATTPDTSDIKSGKLPKPGAKVAVGRVTNSSGESFEFDVESTLQNALVSALKENKIYSDGLNKAPEFIISLDIIEYRPGNAFKRWLLPGYGSTVLSVRGNIKDVNDKSLIASIEHQRSVVAGGAYSIGAWKYIFPSVANDIAKDLKVKIEQGGNFVVYMTTRSDIDPAVKPEPSPYTVKIEPLIDQRTEAGRIGWRTAAFGVSMGDVHFFRRVPEYLRESLQTEINLMGYKIVEAGEDINITSKVHKFWIETDTTPLYWNMIGEIQISLRIDSDRMGISLVERDYSCKKTKRTYAWPTAKLAGKVLDACLDDIMNQIRMDKVWAQK
jgi:uncharacterized lipoprotein YajG